jgi:hypothetical protein
MDSNIYPWMVICFDRDEFSGDLWLYRPLDLIVVVERLQFRQFVLGLALVVAVLLFLGWIDSEH